MLQRQYFAEYERLSRLLLRNRENTSPNLIKKYEKALSDLRWHLSYHNMKMPLPIYPYDPEDEGTHAFIRHIDNPTPIPNPCYLYRKTWVRIDGKKGIS